MRSSYRMLNYQQHIGVTPMWRRGQLQNDLKDTNGVIGFLFGSLPAPADPIYKRAQLTDAQIQHFVEKGWVMSSKPILSSTQLALIEREVNLLLDEDAEVEDLPDKSRLYTCSDINPFLTTPQLFHCSGAWRVMRGLHDLVYHPNLTVVARQVLNDSVRFLHDEIFCKPPMNGSCVVWHQNYFQWCSTAPLAHVTAHIAIDTHTEKNGGLKVVSGSHRWRSVENLIPLVIPDDHDPSVRMNAVRAQLSAAEIEAFDANVHCPRIPAGHALYMHPLLLHGSYSNTTEFWRRSVVVHFCAKATKSLVSAPIFQNTHVQQSGMELSSSFFPIVLP